MNIEWYVNEVLGKYKRIAIAGGPRSGKTTLSGVRIDSREIIHSDSFKEMEWSAASQALCDAVNAIQLSNGELGPVVVEGVAVPRALRKGMQVDAVVWLDGFFPSEEEPELKPGQERMRKACVTVLAEWWARPESKKVALLQAPGATALEVPK